MSRLKSNLATRARQSLNTSETQVYYIPGPPSDEDYTVAGLAFRGIAWGVLMSAAVWILFAFAYIYGK